MDCRMSGGENTLGCYLNMGFSPSFLPWLNYVIFCPNYLCGLVSPPVKWEMRGSRNTLAHRRQRLCVWKGQRQPPSQSPGSKKMHPNEALSECPGSVLQILRPLVQCCIRNHMEVL